MTPQSGLPQNNRVGDLDSFALPFLMRTMGLKLEEVEKLMCKESGLKALSGGHNDIRDIDARADSRIGDSRQQQDSAHSDVRLVSGAERRMSLPA